MGMGMGMGMGMSGKSREIWDLSPMSLIATWGLYWAVLSLLLFSLDGPAWVRLISYFGRLVWNECWF
ncbi:hypothetical protein BDV29DRAFT_166422 [Aspergillus leporis]|jgi:hypothetical protein|uniref:Uncharacterized protein n=1 Tax=Aspergillus leporis TaxID=41062 RepID=A0A5N5XE99_9EURO|nr:hypothetical protein BDV29DRAFT_166422 [Aspergillus leporis]